MNDPCWGILWNEAGIEIIPHLESDNEVITREKMEVRVRCHAYALFSTNSVKINAGLAVNECRWIIFFLL